MNRYTNLTPAKFNPLSLQEIMMVPLYKEKKEEELGAYAAELGLFDNKYLPQDKEEAVGITKGFKDDIYGLSDEMISKGWSRDLSRRATALGRKKDQLLSKEGILGQHGAAYDSHYALVDQVQKMKDAPDWWKRQIINYSSNRYEGRTKGPYNPYHGSDYVDVGQKAIDFASEMTPQTIKNAVLKGNSAVMDTLSKWRRGVVNGDNVDSYLKDSWETITLSPSKIHELTAAYLKGDPTTQNFLNAEATMLGIDPEIYSKGIINASAEVAANTKGRQDIKFDQEMRTRSTNSGDEIPMNLTLTQSAAGAHLRQLAPPGSLLWGFIQTESPVEAYGAKKSEIQAQLRDPSTPLNKKAKLRKELYDVEQVFRIAATQAAADTGVDMDSIIRNSYESSYTPVEGGKKLEPQQAMEAIEEGIFTGIFESDYIKQEPGGEFIEIDGERKFLRRNPANGKVTGIVTPGNNTRDLYDYEKELVDKNQIERNIHIYQDGVGYIGDIKKSDIESIKTMNKRMNQLLKQDDIIPVTSLQIESTPDSEKLYKQISMEMGRQIKANLASINTRELPEEAQEVLDQFIQTGDYKDVSLLGFTYGKNGVNMQVQLPYITDDGKLNAKISMPLGELEADGSLPTPTANLFKKLRRNLNPEGRDMIDLMEKKLRYNMITPDANFDDNNTVDYTNDQTEIIKKQVSDMNSVSALAEEIVNSKDVRVFEPKPSMLGYENDIVFPSNALALAYKNTKGEENILTLGKYVENLKELNPGISDKDIADFMNIQYERNRFLNPLQEELFDPTTGKIHDDFTGFPIITTDIADLLEFE